jgi:hypothetical protein
MVARNGLARKRVQWRRMRLSASGFPAPTLPTPLLLKPMRLPRAKARCERGCGDKNATATRATTCGHTVARARESFSRRWTGAINDAKRNEIAATKEEVERGRLIRLVAGQALGIARGLYAESCNLRIRARRPCFYTKLGAHSSFGDCWRADRRPATDPALILVHCGPRGQRGWRNWLGLSGCC